MTRIATAADLPGLVELCRFRPPPALTVRGLSAADMGEWRLENYRHPQGLDDPNLRILLVDDPLGKPAAFMVLLGGTLDSITQEPQTVLYDFAARPPTHELLHGLLSEAYRFASDRQDEYLVTQLPHGDALESWLEDENFVLDTHRVVKRVNPIWTEAMERASSRYRIRPARDTDHMFILYLSTVSSQNTLPAGRMVDPVAVKTNYLQVYLTLDVGQHQVARIFIAERSEDNWPVGYFMLKCSYQDEVRRTPVGYVYDIAVHPDQWGTQVAQMLVHAAEVALQHAGIDFLLGDISGANPRPLALATQRLGFSIETNRWSLTLAKKPADT